MLVTQTAPSLARNHSDGVATILVGSGHHRNALGVSEWEELRRRAENLARDDSVRVVILRGAGSTFCAGSDISEWESADLEDVAVSFEAMEAAFVAVEQIPVPVIAEVRGAALGAGCQLALSCDLRVMAERATMGMPTTRLGIYPSAQFVRRVAVAAGFDTAAELYFTGRLLGGRESRDRRLATGCVPEQDLTPVVEGMAEMISAQPPAPVRATKTLIREQRQSVAASDGRPIGAPVVDFEPFRQAVSRFLAKDEGTS
jgi:enoyl-CoA hydratase/carnithine racemase